MICWREFFQVQLSGFPEVGDSFFDSSPLADCALRAFGDLEFTFLV